MINVTQKIEFWLPIYDYLIDLLWYTLIFSSAIVLIYAYSIQYDYSIGKSSNKRKYSTKRETDALWWKFVPFKKARVGGMQFPFGMSSCDSTLERYIDLTQCRLGSFEATGKNHGFFGRRRNDSRSWNWRGKWWKICVPSLRGSTQIE